MSINRRQFLKKAGVITALGLGGTFALNGLREEKRVEASEMTSPQKNEPAKRWAMVVDMTKFKTEEDYNRVIKACHSIHNVPDFENSKDEIKWIWKEAYHNTFPGMENNYIDEKTEKMPFMVLCNHCDNPPCVRACPTKATFKNKDGIVSMDFHRCVGCRFCMAACPYGARSFNFRDPRPFIDKVETSFPTRTKGVVEKCNFCVERLGKGLMPACVEKSNGGLVFGDLNDPNSDVRKILSSKYTIRRKPQLGTEPSVFYLMGGEGNV